MSAKSEQRHRARQARELAALLRQQDRDRLRALRASLKAARDARRERVRELVALCRAERSRLKEKRRRLLAELAATTAELKARGASCSSGLASSRSSGRQSVKEAREALELERTEQHKTRQIRRAWEGTAKKSTALERRSDSDDEVRGNIPAELVPVFEKVRRAIRGSDYMSRTEAFLEWVHDNSATVERLMNEAHAEEVAKLEAQERALDRESRKAGRYSSRRGVAKLSADLADVPF